MKACLRAAVHGPFFGDRIFPILFGLTRTEVQEVLDAWPSVHDAEVADVAINNAINNLLGYPHGVSEEDWVDYLPVSREELKEFFKNWRG